MKNAKTHLLVDLRDVVLEFILRGHGDHCARAAKEGEGAETAKGVKRMKKSAELFAAMPFAGIRSRAVCRAPR